MKYFAGLACAILLLLPIPFIVRNYQAYRYVSRGLAFMQQQNPLMALKDFEAATAIQPDNGEFRYYLGKALGWTGETEGAIAELERASLSYHNFQLFAVLGAFYANVGKNREALATLQRGLCFAPDNGDMLQMKGEILLNMARGLLTPKLRDQLDCPADKVLPLEAGFLCEKQIEEATALAQQIPAEDGKALAAKKAGTLALTAMLRNRTDQALSFVTQGLQDNLTDQMMLLWGARALVQTQAPESALELYRSLAMRTSVLETNTLKLLLDELLQAREGLKDEALRDRYRWLAIETAVKAGELQRAGALLQPQPQSLEEQFLQALVTKNEGREPEARAMFLSLLRSYPDYVPARVALWKPELAEQFPRPSKILEIPVVVAP